MQITRTQGLVALNAALLAALTGVVLGPRAAAQSDRRRAEYLITAGSIKGTDASAVWIVDTTNQDLIALVWNAQLGQLEGLGYRDLNADGASLLRPGGGTK